MRAAARFQPGLESRGPKELARGGTLVSGLGGLAEETGEEEGEKRVNPWGGIGSRQPVSTPGDGLSGLGAAHE